MSALKHEPLAAIEALMNSFEPQPEDQNWTQFEIGQRISVDGRGATVTRINFNGVYYLTDEGARGMSNHLHVERLDESASLMGLRVIIKTRNYSGSLPKWKFESGVVVSEDAGLAMLLVEVHPYTSIPSFTIRRRVHVNQISSPALQNVGMPGNEMAAYPA